MTTIAPDPAASTYYSFYKSAVYLNLFVGIAWGIFITFYAVSVHILLGRPGSLSAPSRIFMLGMTTFMFILGLIALVLETAYGFQQARSVLEPLATSGGSWSQMKTNIVFATFETINCIMYILSDIICSWRAVVLWNKDKRVIAILLLFIFGNIVAAGCGLVIDLTPLFNPNIQKDKPRGHALIMVSTTLGINLLCTGLIGWKSWEHRVTIKKHLGEGTVSMRVERVLAILIESGLIYCCLWILYLMAALRVFPEPFASATELALLFAPPTLIIILVCLQKSPVDYYSTYVSGMQFANNEPRSDSHNRGSRVVPVKRLDEEKCEPDTNW